jgi:hypothetical protein
MADDQEKKLIIDDDWKQEAKREKEILAAESKTEKQDAGERGALPPASFQGLLSMFVTQAYLALGLLRVKEDQEPVVDLEMAKYNIDLLGVIEEKTKGNLDEAEAKMLEESLHNLRLAFVQLSQQSG